VCTGRGSKTS